MGTNFYLMSKSKKLIRENFAVEKNYGVTDVEYELVDEPYLGYQIHLNKLSCGWRPLFQRHKNIKSFGVAAYVGDEKKIRNIIKKQMDLPAHQMQRFVTREDNMVEAELVFYETESDEDSVELEFGRELGTAILELPGNLPAGSPIEIQITVNKEGLLTFEGKDCTNGKVVTGKFEVKDGLTQKQVEELREKHKDIVVE